MEHSIKAHNKTIKVEIRIIAFSRPLRAELFSEARNLAFLLCAGNQKDVAVPLSQDGHVDSVSQDLCLRQPKANVRLLL